MGSEELVDQELITQLSKRIFKCDDPIVVMSYSCSLIRVDNGCFFIPKHYLRTINSTELSAFVTADAIILTPLMTPEDMELFTKKYASPDTEPMQSLKMDIGEARSYSRRLREFYMKPMYDEEPQHWNDLGKTPFVIFLAETTVSANSENLVWLPPSFADQLEFSTEAYCVLLNGAVALIPVPEEKNILLTTDWLPMVNGITSQSLLFTTNELLTTMFVRKLSRNIKSGLTEKALKDEIKKKCHEKIGELTDDTNEAQDPFSTKLVADRMKRLHKK